MANWLFIEDWAAQHRHAIADEAHSSQLLARMCTDTRPSTNTSRLARLKGWLLAHTRTARRNSIEQLTTATAEAEARMQNPVCVKRCSVIRP